MADGFHNVRLFEQVPCIAMLTSSAGEHPDLKKIFQVLQRFGYIRRPGNWLVDSFPALARYKLFDLVSNWRTFGADIHRKDSKVWMYFWRRMQAEVDQGTVPHSFGKAFMTGDWQKKG